MGTTVRLRPTFDSFVRADVPNRNFGIEDKLSLKNDAPKRNALINFSLKSIPDDATIHDATLKLTLAEDWAGSRTVTGQRINEKWSERRVTWNNAPTRVGVTGSGTITGGIQGDILNVDVTDLVTAAVERGAEWHGIWLDIDGSGLFKIRSSEAGDQSRWPRLIVEFSVVPDAPNGLRPRGGDKVNRAVPKLAWNAETQSQFQVQANPIDVFSAPSFDTGWILSDENGLDLADYAFSAMADGAEMWWRVRVRNEDGDTSPWSNHQNWIHRTYGTLVIDSPPFDGAAVEEMTPTIVFTFTGRTLTRLGWQLRRKRANEDHFKIIEHDSFENGFRTDDNSFEIGKNPVASVGKHLIRSQIADYRIYIRVWDQFERGTAVGERSYVEKHRDFIYDPSPGVTAVSALAVEPTGSGDPRLLLTWTRGSAPDSYDIYMDGDMVDNNVDPGDTVVSGINNAYLLWEAQPYIEHEFMVVATENHQDSEGNPTVSYTTETQGIWILCKREELAVPIYGTESAEMALGESSFSFDLLNRQAPVRIVDVVRGLEGKVQGVLIERDRTAAQVRRHLLRMKEIAPQVEVRLVASRLNFPVILGNITLPATPLGEEMYQVSVEYEQDGEFEVDWDLR